MKTRFALFLSCLSCVSWSLTVCAADPLTESLQKGLLEEEVNRDFNAAVKAYESAVKQADAQRPAAATAVFRLAESYRKLGRTNDAVAQYRRVLADFADQALLAGLSRTNLLRLGVPAGASAGGAENPTEGAVKTTLETRLLAAQLAGIERLKGDPEKQAQAVLAFFPDDGLKRMLLHLPRLQQQAAWFTTNPDARTNAFAVAIGPEGQTLMSGAQSMTPALAQSELQVQNANIASRVQFILDTQHARLAVLQSAEASGAAEVQPASAPDPAAVASLREEIQLVEQVLMVEQVKFANGKAEAASVRQAQRDLLKLQRQLPENAGRDRQVALVQDELKLVEENLAEIQKKIQIGAAPPLDALSARRELLAVQRELDAAKRLPEFATAAVAAPAGSAPATSEEAAEIQRIQAIIRNSPDLVNARNATASGGTPLHMAAGNGYVAVAEFLLANQADVNARQNDGSTPLQLAAAAGHKRLCELLLAKGADVKATDNRAYTPLHLAAQNGYLGVIETLLAAGAEVNTKGFVPSVGLQPRAGQPNWNEMETTPLHSAAEKGFPAVVELLLKNGAEINARDRGGRTPLTRAILANRAATARLLLEKGADVNAKDGGEQTALAHAVARESVPLVELLLDFKADPEIRVGSGNPEIGWTVLFQPVGEGKVALTRLLLDRGANVNARATTGISPVHWAVLQNAPATLKLLLERKADVNVRDSGDNTPLHYALANPNPPTIEALLAAGADPNAAGWNGGEEKGWPPLLAASQDANQWPLSLAETLLKHGADVNGKLTNGWTALHRAVQFNRADLAELLVTNKADINARGSWPKGEPELGQRKAEGTKSSGSAGLPGGGPGRRLAARGQPGIPMPVQVSVNLGAGSLPANSDVTPLHVAVANQNLELAKFLLEHGADVNARDAGGRTPLHFAVDRRDLDLIRLLLDGKAEPDAKDSTGTTPLGLASGLSLGSRPVSVPNRGNLVPTPEPSLIVKLLRERGAKDPEDPAMLLSIEVDPTGQYRVEGRPMTLGELGGYLSAPERAGKSARLTVRAEEGVEPKGLSELMKLLKEKDVVNVTVQRIVVPRTIFTTDPVKAQSGGQVAFFGAVRGNGLLGNLFTLIPGGTTSLSQALLQVGFAENARMSQVKFTRVNPETKLPETKTVNLLGLKRGETTEEILLQDGDRVEVPKQE